jgi:hypothetical protein
MIPQVFSHINIYEFQYSAPEIFLTMRHHQIVKHAVTLSLESYKSVFSTHNGKQNDSTKNPVEYTVFFHTVAFSRHGVQSNMF